MDYFIKCFMKKLERCRISTKIHKKTTNGTTRKSVDIKSETSYNLRIVNLRGERMQLKVKDEEKRTKAWSIVMITSTIIIILVGAFFITNSITRNPLEGTWVAQENGYYMEISDENEMKVTGEGLFDGVYTEVDLYYTIDKQSKILTIKSDPEAYEEAASAARGKLTAQEINSALQEMVTAFDYSLDQDTLTLTEREYGDQFVFTRSK